MLFLEKFIIIYIIYISNKEDFMKKLPDIFKPGIDHYLNNNKEVYYSFIDQNNQTNKTSIKDKKSLRTGGLKIINLLANDVMFNKRVLIKTNNEEYKTEILSKMGNNIIISNGKVLSVFDIQSIELI